MQESSFSANLGANYELIEQIGAGASGIVWRARDKRDNSVVVAKILREEHTKDLDLVTRFVKERALLIALKGPEIVEVKDLVVEGSRLAIIMEYVDGISLRDVLQSGSMPPSEAAIIVLHVLNALKIAHQANVVHRDVKPDNVLLTKGWQKGKQGSIKLTDFGISRIITEGHSTSTTLVGTPEYLSPELIERGEASYPADMYSAGIMFYELLASRTPFAGKGTDFTILHRHTTAEVPPLAVRQQLWELLLKMLEKRPHIRIDVDSAIDSLKALLPVLEDDPALEPQDAPDEFTIAYGPMTVLRGNDIGAQKKVVADSQPDELPQMVVPDLGESGTQTILRPRTHAEPSPRVEVEEAPSDESSKLSRSKVVITSALGVLVVVALVIGGYFMFGGKSSSGNEQLVAAITDEPLASGLVIERKATYIPEDDELEFAVTYRSTGTPIAGPFFEVVQLDGICPNVAWNMPDQTRNISAQTYIDTPCGWSLEPGVVDGVVSIVGTIGVDDLSFTQSELEQWINENAQATNAALSNPDVQSSAYPAQRLTGFSVQVASRTLSGEPIKVALLPIWASGVDELNPLYVTPHTGELTQVFTAVAHDETHLRFVDGCAGAVSVSRDGLTMTALRPASQCEVHVQLGDFDEVSSNQFEIVGHDS